MTTTDDFNALDKRVVRIAEMTSSKMRDEKSLSHFVSIARSAYGVKHALADDELVYGELVFSLRFTMNTMVSEPLSYRKGYVGSVNLVVLSDKIERLPMLAQQLIDLHPELFLTYTDQYGNTYGGKTR